MFNEHSFIRHVEDKEPICPAPHGAEMTATNTEAVETPDVLGRRFVQMGTASHRSAGQPSPFILLLGSGAIMDAIVAKMPGDMKNQCVAETMHPLPNDFAIPMEIRNEWKDSLLMEPADVKMVVVADDHPEDLPVQFLLSLRSQGVPVVSAAAYYEEISGRIPVEYVRPTDLIFGRGFVRSSYGRLIKRCMDIGLAVLGGLVALPLFLILPLWIKWDSKGPVFYRQERMGLKGHRFNIFKFRTMVENAEVDSGPVYAEESDARVTRVGRLLRKFRLDELPQLLNILRGEMSFVGPRPERPCFINVLREEIPYYDLRLSIKPGLTGWAQIMFHYAATNQEHLDKFGYDLYYIKHMSFLFDLAIIMDTVRVVLTEHGAR